LSKKRITDYQNFLTTYKQTCFEAFAKVSSFNFIKLCMFTQTISTKLWKLWNYIMWIKNGQNFNEISMTFKFYPFR